MRLRVLPTIVLEIDFGGLELFGMILELEDIM